MSTTIAASEFKAKCLALLDVVATTDEEIVITKHGRAVARLVPIVPEHKSLTGSVSYAHDDDVLSPIDEEWDADQ